MSTPKEAVKAKELSKWGIALGVTLVVILSLVRGFWPLFGKETVFGLTQVDILLLGLFCIGAWSPVFLSMWFDKFLGDKAGG